MKEAKRKTKGMHRPPETKEANSVDARKRNIRGR